MWCLGDWATPTHPGGTFFCAPRRAPACSVTSPAAPLITLDAVTAVRAGGEIAVRNLTWTMREGETWAVVGPVGSGKTSLAEVLTGRHRVTAGRIAWPLLDR